MKKSREFSAQSIKQLAASLPDTYYGNACNISLKSDCITFRSAVGGDPLRFDDFGISLCCGGEISSEVNLMRQTVSEGDFELYSPGTIYRMDSISDDCRQIGISKQQFHVQVLQGPHRNDSAALQKQVRMAPVPGLLFVAYNLCYYRTFSIIK